MSEYACPNCAAELGPGQECPECSRVEIATITAIVAWLRAGEAEARAEAAEFGAGTQDGDLASESAHWHRFFARAIERRDFKKRKRKERT